MYLSGTKAPFRIVSSLLVARIPRVSQVCLISYPSVSLGMNAWTTIGCSGSEVSIARRPRRVQTGERLPNILWPVKR
jgi:hypothetical protein